MNDWKVGDKFVVVGPEHELKRYAWCEHKETRVGTIHKIDRISDDGLVYCKPFKDNNTWYIKPTHIARPSKLHKALL